MGILEELLLRRVSTASPEVVRLMGRMVRIVSYWLLSLVWCTRVVRFTVVRSLLPVYGRALCKAGHFRSILSFLRLVLRLVLKGSIFYSLGGA